MSNSTKKNIHPIFHELLQRQDKELLLNQRAKVIWLTGLSGSGKSTIAKELEKALYRKRYITKLLDGDNIRTGLNNNVDFSESGREENIRRIAEVSKLFIECGIITINSFVSPTEAIRSKARNIIGSDDYIEVFVDCPLEVCEERDVKGLYKKARKGEISDFTGISAPFENPQQPHLVIHTDKMNVEESVKKILEFILPKIKYQEEQ